MGKGVDITEEKIKEVLQLPPITIENCHEREDGDLQWDEITFEEEVNGKYWHALIMALHRVREDFIKKQRKMKHLDWYLTMKVTSGTQNIMYSLGQMLQKVHSVCSLPCLGAARK